MSTFPTAQIQTPQRWTRPFYFPPGHWKKQLPGRILRIAAQGNVEALQVLLAKHPEYLNKRGPHNRKLLWEATRHEKRKLLAKEGNINRGSYKNGARN